MFLPTQEMLRDRNLEWGLSATGVTRDVGITVATSWSPRIGLMHELRNARIVPLACPYDVLKGGSHYHH